MYLINASVSLFWRRLSSCFPALSFSSSSVMANPKFIHSGLIYISRYFILQFDRIFFNLIYTPSINWSRILGSEGVSAVVGEEMGREDEFRIQQFEMDFRITFHDVSFNALSIIYQKCISSIIFGLYCALSEWGAWSWQPKINGIMTQLPHNQTRNMETWNHPTFLHRGSRRQTAAAAQHPPEEQLGV